MKAKGMTTKKDRGSEKPLAKVDEKKSDQTDKGNMAGTPAVSHQHCDTKHYEKWYKAD